MKNVKKIAVATGVAALALAPFLAFAQPPSIAPSPTVAGPITSTQTIINLINRILFWVATLFWIAAVGFVFYAAFLYLTAAGNEDQVHKAGQALLYAAVAVAVGIMAYGLPVLVGAFLRGQ